MNDFLSEADAFEQASQTSSSDDVLPDYSESAAALSDPFYEFKLDRYRLDGINLEEFGIVHLNPHAKGYFTVVEREDFDMVTAHNWSVNVHRDPTTGNISKIYAYRKASKKEREKGAPIYVYLHRFLTSTTLSGKRAVVDHRNGISLDNRRQNLRTTTQAHNIGNIAVHPKTVNHSLPRGVKPVKRTRNGIRVEMFLARIRVGTGKEMVSRITFSCPLRAGRWYQRMHALIHPEACLVNNTNAVTAPIKFPPLAEIYTDVPF